MSDRWTISQLNASTVLAVANLIEKKVLVSIQLVQLRLAWAVVNDRVLLTVILSSPLHRIHLFWLC